MASSITFFVFLTLAISFTTIHARESQFFAKVSNNIPQESQQPLNTNEKDLKFVPQTQEPSEGYGLFGHESGQLPPSSTTNNNNYETKPSYLPENYNPVAYTTPMHSNTQENSNQFSYEPQDKVVNNNYNFPNQQEFMQTNNDNLFNSQNQEEFTQTNDATSYNNNQELYNNNNYEKQGMSDTRFLNNGKYYYASDNSQNQGFNGAKFTETQESGNDDLFNNNKEQSVNGYNDQEMYNTGSQGMSENNFATNNNGGYMNNPGKQGMSDTRFLENGKFYYDLNLENQKFNSRGVRNGHETYGNYNDNSYDRFNNGGNQFNP